MKKKKSFLPILVSVILVLALGTLIFFWISKNSMYPYKENKEITECWDYHKKELDQTKRIEFLKTWLTKYFDNIEVHRMYQDLMQNYGQYSTLKQEYKDYLANNRENAMFMYLYGRLLSSTESEALFKESLTNNANYYWGHLGLAYYYFHDSNPQKTELAKAHLDKALDIDQTKPHAYFSILNIFRAERNYEKKLEVLEVLTKFFPKSRDELFIEYAELRYTKREEYFEVLKKKLKQIPDSIALRKTLADLCLSEGKADEALIYLEDALSYAYNDDNLKRNIHLQIATIYGKKELEKETIDHLKEASKIGLEGEEWIKEHENFAFLKDNKEFIEILKDAGIGLIQ